MTSAREKALEPTANHGYGDPVISYFLASCAASVTFVISMLGFKQYDIGLAIFIWILGGFLPAQVSMTIPWALAVRYYRHTRIAGWLYFPLIGAAATVMLGCTAEYFSPRLLNVEDQTMFEAASIALERQGLSFALSGLIFGLTYWIVSVRFPRLL